MRATMLYTAGDVRVEDAPDAALQDPTDAVFINRPRRWDGALTPFPLT